MMGTGLFTRLTTIAVFAFLCAPIVIVVFSAFSATGYMTFPPGAMSLRWFSEFLRSADWMRTLGITAVLSLIASVVSVSLSFALAFVVVRKKAAITGIMEFLVMLPLILPHAALAIAILAIVLKTNLLGTFTGVLLAHMMIALPYAYRSVVVSLRKLDVSLEEAAMSLRASPAETFFRITLPLVKPGLITALLFSFIVSFDEATITLFLVGPNFTTMPIKIFSAIQDNASPIVAAISTVLIVITIGIVLTLERLIGLQILVDPERRQ